MKNHTGGSAKTSKPPLTPTNPPPLQGGDDASDDAGEGDDGKDQCERTFLSLGGICICGS